MSKWTESKEYKQRQAERDEHDRKWIQESEERIAWSKHHDEKAKRAKYEVIKWVITAALIALLIEVLNRVIR